MRPMQVRRLFQGGLALAAVTLALALRAHPAAHAAPAARATPGSMQTMPATPPAGAPAGNPSPAEIQQLQTQIQSLRAELHQQLDPLQSQVKALHDKYDPQIASLEEQRRTLVEQGKPQAIQDLDKQEESELAALGEREKADIAKLRAQYADQRKAIEESYKAKRGEAKTAKN
jgi:hypothetical protein